MEIVGMMRQKAVREAFERSVAVYLLSFPAFLGTLIALLMRRLSNKPNSNPIAKKLQ